MSVGAVGAAKSPTKPEAMNIIENQLVQSQSQRTISHTAHSSK
jgi:hypothetical protein